MNKSLLRALSITAALTAAAYLVSTPLLRVLERRPHPLVMDITCKQSGNASDFYWKINQIFVTRVDIKDTLEVYFSHSVPNFASYYVKMGKGDNWEKLNSDMLSLSPPGKNISFFVKATNLFGGETSPFYYSIEIKDGLASVLPHIASRTLGQILFRFEQFTAPEMAFLREQTFPVAGTQHDEWQKVRALRSWVNTAIPFGNPQEDSNWNAVAILKQARSHPKVVFLCDEHAAVFVSACISAGLNARMIQLRSKTGDGHYAAEVWSDQQQKWVYMDPLYDFSCCEKGSCYSALDLHNLYLRNKNSSYQHLPVIFPQEGYLNLFHEFQVIMVNDFLSHPYNSVWELISGRITTLRWIDPDTPPLNKWRAAGEILIYYYAPKIGRPLIIAIGIFMGLGVVIFYAKQNRQRLTP